MIVTGQKYGILTVCLLYAAIVTIWQLNYNSVYHDEALNITMGNQVLGMEYSPGAPKTPVRCLYIRSWPLLEIA